MPTNQVKRALLSVYNKDGLIDFARGLDGLGIQLVSSGGTAAALRAAKLAVIEVSDVTGFPEILDGRVKTLNPKVHGGILARRDNETDLRTLERYGITAIDLVCVNLYPFEQTIASPSCTFEQAIENIDVGGPCMIRSAAKNHRFVYTITRPAQYAAVLRSLRERGCWVDPALSEELAKEAFATTARYDMTIQRWLSGRGGAAWPKRLFMEFRLGEVLRYGENPHQSGAVYWEVPGSRPVMTVPSSDAKKADSDKSRVGAPGPSRAVPALASARQLAGKELSYNNLYDADAAWALVNQFDLPSAVVVKHANPCGCATADTNSEAFELAYNGDTSAAFGGIVAFNRVVDRITAEAICRPGRFLEVIVAPGFTDDAVARITAGPAWGKNVRLLSFLQQNDSPEGLLPMDPGGSSMLGGSMSGLVRAVNTTPSTPLEMKRIAGGLLIQPADIELDDEAEWKVVSQRTPDEREYDDLVFAWNVVRHVKSNAVVVASNKTLVGVGAGQMKRLDSSHLAVRLAGDRSRGSVAASDAFFPFRDGLDELAKAGITAVIQPGGSKRDDEVIKAADEHKIAMIFTGRRHFKH